MTGEQNLTGRVVDAIATHGPMTTKEIATAVSVDRDAIAKHLRHMKERRLIERGKQLPGGRHPWRLAAKGELRVEANVLDELSRAVRS